MYLRCGSRQLSLARPLVMGVVNVTPDSFSDGSRYLEPAAAIDHALALIEAGADIIDIGAESSRPDAAALSLEEELARLAPVLLALRDVPAVVSVDTYKPAVMRYALDAGAGMINDIWAARQAGALEVLRESDCAVCLMHMQGTPQYMQRDPQYRDVVAEVHGFLAARVGVVREAGVADERIVVDPGFGFGKTLEHNLALLRAFDRFADFGVASLAGLSRKNMLGRITGKPVGERDAASIAAALAAVGRGASIVRVHDVAGTVDALKVWKIVDNPDCA